MGFGAVGVGVVSVLGLRAMSLQKEADAGCDRNGCFAPGASQKNSDAIRFANLATVGFGVGLVGVGVGTFLLLTSGSGSASTHAASTAGPQVGAALAPGGGQVTVSSVW